MNKKKIAALALALSITVGASVLGTYAYFTATTSVSNSIVLSTGTVTVESEDNNWEYVSQGLDESQDITDASYTNNLAAHNLRPGDKFEKKITVKYTGSLTGKLKIAKAATTTAPFVLSIEQVDNVVPAEGQEAPANVDLTQDQSNPNLYTTGPVNNGATVTFKVTLEVPTSVGNGGNNINQNLSSTFVDPTNLIDVTATQINNTGWN